MPYEGGELACVAEFIRFSLDLIQKEYKVEEFDSACDRFLILAREKSTTKQTRRVARLREVYRAFESLDVGSRARRIEDEELFALCEVLRQEAVARGNWSDKRGEAITMKLQRAGYTGTQRFPVLSSISKALEDSDDEGQAARPGHITVIAASSEGAVDGGGIDTSNNASRPRAARRGVMATALMDSSDDDA